MSIVQSSEPTESLDFHLKHLTRLKIFDGSDRTITNASSLLASSSKYGLIFVGTPTGFQTIILSSIIGKDLPSGNEGVTGYPRRETQLQSQPSHLGVSCDQLHLVVATKKSGSAHAIVYSVASFLSQNIVIVNEVRLTTSPDVFAVDLSWNPGIGNMLASCMSDGSVSCYEFLPTGVNLNSIPPEARATCLCWSPKGKQIVIGSQDGTLTQYKPDLKAVKTLPPPPVPNGQFGVINLTWLSNFQFAAFYHDRIADKQALIIVNTPKGAPMVFVNYDDICYTSEKMRNPQFYLLHQQSWNVILVGSANCAEISVLGLGPDQASWVQWTQEDSSRAELPLSPDRQESFLVGMTLDCSNTYQLPWGENNSQSIGPFPVLLLLSHRGVLCVYNMLNLKANAAPVCSPPKQPSDLSGLSLFTTQGSVAPSQPPPPPYTAPTSGAMPAFGATPFQPAANTFAPAVNPPAGLFKLPPSTAPTPNLFGAPANVQAPATTASIFGGGAPTTNLFAAALPPKTETPNPLSSTTSAPSMGFGLPTMAPSSGFGAPTTGFTFSNLAATGFGSGTASSFTPAVSGDVARTTASAFGGSQFSFGGGGFLAGAAPQATSLFGGGSEQLKSGFAAQMPSTTSQLPQSTIDFTQQASSLATADASKRSPVSATVLAPAVPPSPQSVQSLPSPPHQPQIAVAPVVQAVEVAKPEAEEPTINDSIFEAAIQEEMSSFETELQELKNRIKSINIQIGTDEEKSDMCQRVQKLSVFACELKDTTKGLSNEIQVLQSVILEVFSWIEEAKSRERQLQSPIYQQLARARELDPSSARRLSSIQDRAFYVNSQLQQVVEKLDDQWLELKDMSKNKSKQRLEPPLEPVFRTMVAHNAIIARQRAQLACIVQRIQGLKNSNWNITTNVPHLITRDDNETELSQLAESLLQVRFTPTAPSQLTHRKQTKLRCLMSNHAVVRLHPTRPQVCSSALLELPPMKLGSISTGTPFGMQKAASPIPPPAFMPKTVPSTGPGACSTPVGKPIAPASALNPTLKLSKSLPKNLTDYYEDITPPNTPEPEVEVRPAVRTPKMPDQVPIKSPLMSLDNIVSAITSSTKPESKEKPKPVSQEATKPPPLFGGFGGSEPAPKKTTQPFSFGSSSIFGSQPKLSSENPVVSPFGQSSVQAKPGFSMFGGASSVNVFGQPDSTHGSPKKMNSGSSEKKSETISVPSFGFGLPSKPLFTEKTPQTEITYTVNPESPPETSDQKTTVITVSFPGMSAEPKSDPNPSTGFSFAMPPSKAPEEQSSFLGQPICSPSSTAFAKPPTTTASSIFGGSSSTSLFGTTTSSSAIFGSSLTPSTTAPSFGGSLAVTTSAPDSSSTITSVIETPAATPTSTTVAPPIFGTSTAVATPLFGGTTSAFGGISAPSTTFVAATTTTTPSLFGTGVTTSLFGGSSSAVSTPLFGATSSAVATAPLFGGGSPATTTANIFGGSIGSTSVFGGTVTTTVSTPLFGGSTTSTASTPFGTPTSSVSTPLFGGSTAATTPLFGAVTTAASVFGGVSSTTPTTPLFGGTSPTSTSPPLFGGAGSPLFGATPATTAAAPLFGSTSPAVSTPLFGAATTTATTDSLSSLFGSTSMFGASSTPATTQSLFGQAPAAAPLFGQAGPFGSTPAPASPFSVAAGTGGSLFGGGFGSASPSPSVFGQQSTSTPLFGQQSPTSVFGQGTTATPTTTASVFGSTPTPFGGFGSSQPVFGQSGGALFGQSASNPSGGFGSSGASVFGGGGTSLFGGNTTATSSGNLFQSSASGFGSGGQSPGGGLFSSGAGQSISQGGFGGPAAFGAKPGGFGSAPAFGSPGGGGGGFGAAPLFGGTPAFGGAPAFGGSPNKLFGSTSPPQTGFGSPTQQSSTFENLASQNTMTFGNLAQTQPQGFGSPQPQQSLFGSPQQSATQSPPAFSGGSSFSSWR